MYLHLKFVQINEKNVNFKSGIPPLSIKLTEKKSSKSNCALFADRTFIRLPFGCNCVCKTVSFVITDVIFNGVAVDIVYKAFSFKNRIVF